MRRSMLSEVAQQEASTILLDHWREGRHLDGLPERCRPTTLREGYAIQAGIERDGTQPIAGWKIAATSQAGQAHIGVDGPMAGRLPADRVVGDGASVPLGSNRMLVAEVEFVFRLGRDLAPRATPYGGDEVLDAVDALHLGIELPDSRFLDFVTAGAPQLAADFACANHFVLGPEAPAGWRDIDLAAWPVKGIVTERLERDGIGANVLGDPRIALTWLANALDEIGTTLRAGQFVTTGTCLKPIDIAPGDEVIGDFGELGRVSVRLS